MEICVATERKYIFRWGNPFIVKSKYICEKCVKMYGVSYV